MNYETTAEVELAIARHFGIRENVIIPNVSWAIFRNRECDLVVLNRSGYCDEIEIKVSRSDLIKDKEKWHKHSPGTYFKRLWFAIPNKLVKDIEQIPLQAGILVVSGEGIIVEKRPPITNKSARKLSYEDRYKLARLGAIRMWRIRINLSQLLRQRKTESEYENAKWLGKYCV